MEKVNQYLIPPIFKLSHLWKILPYFGDLHRWIWIMRWLSKKTGKIWDENQKAFRNLGKKSKAHVKILDLNPTQFQSRINFEKPSLDQSTKLYKPLNFLFNGDLLAFDYILVIEQHVKKLWSKIKSILIDDIALIFDNSYRIQLKIPQGVNIIDQYQYKMICWDQEQILKHIPAIQWSNSGVISKNFNINSCRMLSEYIIQSLYDHSVILEKSGANVKVTLAKSSVISIPRFPNFDNIHKELVASYSNWSDQYWLWRPTQLLVNNWNTIHMINKNLFESIKTINAIIIRSLHQTRVWDLSNTVLHAMKINKSMLIDTLFKRKQAKLENDQWEIEHPLHTQSLIFSV